MDKSTERIHQNYILRKNGEELANKGWPELGCFGLSVLLVVFVIPLILGILFFFGLLIKTLFFT